MKLAIIYEKVKPSESEDIYLLKPVDGVIGKCDKKGVFHADDEEYHSYNDAESLRNDDNYIFYGNPIEIKEFAKEHNYNYGTEEYNYALQQYYYDQFHGNLLSARVDENRVHVEHLDLSRAANCTIKEGLDKFIDENRFIAVMYKKNYIIDGVKYLYTMTPETVMYGDYDEETDTYISGDKIYYPINNKEALEQEQELYFDGVHFVNDLMTIDDEITMEDFSDLKERFARSTKNHIVLLMCGEVISPTLVNYETLVRESDKKEVTKDDEIICSIISAALAKLDSELSDNDKKILFEFYQILARFLYAEGAINHIKLVDVTPQTYDKCIKGYYEIVRALDSLGIREELGNANINVDTDKTVDEKPFINDYSKSKFPEQSFDDIYSGITKVVIGQDKHVEKIVSVLYKRLIELKLNKNIPSRFGLLVTGSPGSGKSEIFQTFAKIVNFPIQFIDSTQLTEAGYAGMGPSPYLEHLYNKYKGDINKVSDSFIVFDELDKIKAHQGEMGADVNGKGAQDGLLKFIDGTDYDLSQLGMNHPNVVINTARMTPIAIGAFAELLRQELIRNIGFNSKNNQEVKDRILTDKDLMEYGMGDQLVGRLYIYEQLDRLNVDGLIRVMNESVNSPLLVQEAVFGYYGLEVVFENGYKREIAQKAYDGGTGCRALYKYIADSTFAPIPELDRNRGKYKKLIFTKECVNDYSKYKLIER